MKASFFCTNTYLHGAVQIPGMADTIRTLPSGDRLSQSRSRSNRRTRDELGFDWISCSSTITPRFCRRRTDGICRWP